jgi:hypothetical protein
MAAAAAMAAARALLIGSWMTHMRATRASSSFLRLPPASSSFLRLPPASSRTWEVPRTLAMMPTCRTLGATRHDTPKAVLHSSMGSESILKAEEEAPFQGVCLRARARARPLGLTPGATDALDGLRQVGAGRVNGSSWGEAVDRKTEAALSLPGAPPSLMAPLPLCQVLPHHGWLRTAISEHGCQQHRRRIGQWTG